MHRILVLFCLIPLLSRAEHKSVLEDKDLKIEFAPAETVDFQVGLSDDSSGAGSQTKVEKVGRKDEAHKNTVGSDAKHATDDSKSKDKKAEEPKDTKEYVVNVKYDGKEGWVRAQIDPATGKAASATFSSSYDGEGQKIGGSVLGPNGKQLPLTEDTLRAAALGEGQFTVDGKLMTKIDSPGSGGGGSGSGGGC